jgi:hypothetical protein
MEASKGRDAPPVRRRSPCGLSKTISFVRVTKATPGASARRPPGSAVRSLFTDIEELILVSDTLAPQFHCILERPGRLDMLTVCVECRPGVTPHQRLDAAQVLTQRIKARIGVSVNVDVVEPGSIERSAGKATRLIDRRPKIERTQWSRFGYALPR